MKHRLLSPPALLVYGLLLAFFAISWSRLADVEMSWQGWLAFGLGCVLSLALAGLLMGLLFYSNRSGADERTGGRRSTRDTPAERPRGKPSGDGDDRS